MIEQGQNCSAFKSEPLERDLLELALEDIVFPTGANPKGIESLVAGLTEKTPGIFFPFFWSHRDVEHFQAKSLSDISLDDAIWYLYTLRDIFGDRYPFGLHWMEMSNLYHVFGLLRLLAGYDGSGQKAAAKAIRETFLPAEAKQLRSIAEVSAFSTLAILEDREPREMEDYLVLLVTSPKFLQFYGTYQVYYYGGLDPCLSCPSTYPQKKNTLFLPQSILGLLAIRKRIRAHDPILAENRIKKELLDLLDTPARHMTERFLPKTEFL